jgi:cyanate permease
MKVAGKLVFRWTRLIIWLSIIMVFGTSCCFEMGITLCSRKKTGKEILAELYHWEKEHHTQNLEEVA